jgi:hypothetical protein
MDAGAGENIFQILFSYYHSACPVLQLNQNKFSGNSQGRGAIKSAGNDLL